MANRPTCHLETCDRPTDNGLCHPHRRDLITHLDALRTHVDELNTQLTRQARYSTAASGDGTSPVVWNEGASRTLDRIRRTLNRWDRLTQDRLGQPVRHPNPIHAAAAIRHAVSTGRLDTWRPLATLLTDLTDIADRTARTIDRPRVEHLLGICTTTLENGTTCDTKLYGNDDTQEIDCPSCGTPHLADTDRELLLTLSEDTLVTAAQAARAMSVRQDADRQQNRLVYRISKWETRGRILSRGTITDAGRQRKLYRLGDVRALVDDHDRTTTRR